MGQCFRMKQGRGRLYDDAGSLTFESEVKRYHVESSNGNGAGFAGLVAGGNRKRQRPGAVQDAGARFDGLVRISPHLPAFARIKKMFFFLKGGECGVGCKLCAGICGY